MIGAHVFDAAHGAVAIARRGETIVGFRRYFAGEPVDFGAVAVGLDGQTDLAARVHAHIRRLAWGETTTYGVVAQALESALSVCNDPPPPGSVR